MGVSLVRAPRESRPDVCTCPVAIRLDLYGSRRRQLLLLFLLLHGMMSTIGSMTIPPIVLLLLLACQYGRQPRAGPQRVSSRRMYMSGRHSPRLVRLASSAAPRTPSPFSHFTHWLSRVSFLQKYMSEVPVLPDVTRLWRFPLANLAWLTLPAHMPAPIMENNWFTTDMSPLGSKSWKKLLGYVKESNWCAIDYDGGVADSHLRLPTSWDRTVLPMTTASLRDMVATTPLRRPDSADRAATIDPWLSPASSGEDLSVLLRRAILTLTLRPTCLTCIRDCRLLPRYHRFSPPLPISATVTARHQSFRSSLLLPLFLPLREPAPRWCILASLSVGITFRPLVCFSCSCFSSFPPLLDDVSFRHPCHAPTSILAPFSRHLSVGITFRPLDPLTPQPTPNLTSESTPEPTPKLTMTATPNLPLLSLPNQRLNQVLHQRPYLLQILFPNPLWNRLRNQNLTNANNHCRTDPGFYSRIYSRTRSLRNQLQILRPNLHQNPLRNQ
jgi:hypothetical protein